MTWTRQQRQKRAAALRAAAQAIAAGQMQGYCGRCRTYWQGHHDCAARQAA